MEDIYKDWKIHNGRLSLIRSNKLEEADGQAHTRNEWCKILGIATKTLRKHLKEHTMQEVVDMYRKKLTD